MQYKIAFFDKEGNEYGVLDKVDENTTLSNLRLKATQSLSIPTSYLFIWKDTPISLLQEAILNVRKCGEVTCGVEHAMKIVIRINSARKSSNSSENLAQANDIKRGENKDVNREMKPGKLMKKFREEEITDPNISRLEKERRCFWNDLSSKVDSHPMYKHWNLQARNGVVDTEWTLKKTELLKIDAEVVLKRLSDKQTEKCQVRQYTSGNNKTKKILENLDRLLQAEFNRKTSYKRIEDLHKDLKSSSTDRHKNEEKISNEEDILDTIFTELKSSQLALEMAITRSCVYREDDVDSCKNNSVDSMTCKSPELTDDEMMNVVTSTMEDFNVEYA